MRLEAQSYSEEKNKSNGKEFKDLCKKATYLVGFLMFALVLGLLLAIFGLILSEVFMYAKAFIIGGIL